MSPPDAPPLATRLARWSDWWFTPRWRALLTWLALSGIVAGIMDADGRWFYIMAQQPIAFLNRLLPAPLPPIFNEFAFGLTASLWSVWFEPLALRLSLWRGLAWIGFQLVADILWQFLFSSLGYHRDWTDYAITGGSTVLQCCVLWGWRSRPWICLPAWAAASGLSISASLLHLGPPHLLLVAVTTLPYAALLLYGTRLLRPEQRARGTTVKLTVPSRANLPSHRGES